MRLLEDEVNQLLDKEAKMWRQQSKIAWLCDGDRNTRFSIAKPLNTVGGTILPSCMMLMEDGAQAKLKLMPPL